LFPNTIGGPIDLSNVADRIVKPTLKKAQWEFLGHTTTPRVAHAEGLNCRAMLCLALQLKPSGTENQLW